MNLRDSLESLRQYVEAQDFAGYDPYDALRSPILNRLAMGKKLPKIAFTQLLRRLPWTLSQENIPRARRSPSGESAALQIVLSGRSASALRRASDVSKTWPFPTSSVPSGRKATKPPLRSLESIFQPRMFSADIVSDGISQMLTVRPKLSTINFWPVTSKANVSTSVR